METGKLSRYGNLGNVDVAMGRGCTFPISGQLKQVRLMIATTIYCVIGWQRLTRENIYRGDQ